MLKKNSYEEKTAFFIPFDILLLRTTFAIVETKFIKWNRILQASSHALVSSQNR